MQCGSRLLVVGSNTSPYQELRCSRVDSGCSFGLATGPPERLPCRVVISLAM